MTNGTGGTGCGDLDGVYIRIIHLPEIGRGPSTYF